MTDNKKTAVRWFAKVVADMGYVSTEVLNLAEAMEKEQVIEAYRAGRVDQQSGYHNKAYHRTAAQYYEGTFKQENNETDRN